MGILKRRPAGYFDIRKNQQEAAVVRPAGQARVFDGHVFICGLHRSGTTMVEAMLHAHCELSVLRCDEVSENEGQHLQDVYPRALDHGGPGKFAFSPAMHSDPAVGDTSALRERMLRCWTPWVEGDAGMLLEKSPPNLVRINWLRSVFPGAKFVIVTRDPRVVAAATAKWARMSVPELVFHWHVAHAAAAAAMGADCAHVRYEDLCKASGSQIARIVGELGLPKRASALTLPERFQSMSNTNAGYLSGIPAFEFGPGIWEQFGYRLKD